MTDDPGCPIDSYSVSELNLENYESNIEVVELPSGKITQPQCPSPKNSLGCRSVSINSKKPMEKVIRFSVGAKGGSILNTTAIKFTVLKQDKLKFGELPSKIPDLCTHKPNFNFDA
jgi:hypothetical protein